MRKLVCSTIHDFFGKSSCAAWVWLYTSNVFSYTSRTKNIWHCKSLNLWFLDHSSCEIITIIWGITGQMCFSIRPSLRNHCALSYTSMKKMQ